jgi:fimbrial chaperone protein
MKRVLALAVSAFMLLVTGHAAFAEGVGVLPVRVYIDAKHRVQTIVISNHDAVNHVFQVSTFRWSQAGEREIQTPTDDLIISPPVFTLIPESQQVIRIALKNPAPVASELTYRLLLRMVGAPADETSVSVSGLGLRLQFSVPVFVASPQGDVTKLAWSYRDLGANKLELTIANTGTSHAHVEHLTLSDSRGSAYDDSINRYVLSGNTVVVQLHTSRPLTADTLNARVTFDTGSAPQQIVIHRGP